MNVKSAFNFPDTVIVNIEALLSAGYIHSPFLTSPLLHFYTSPLSTVPKKYISKCWYIHLFSWLTGVLVNDKIPEEEVTIICDTFTMTVSDIESAD